MNSARTGFTLMELIMVIVILGILAAVAAPRFLNLTGDASAAARSGVVGSLNTAIQSARSRWIAQGSPATVSLDGGGPITMSAGGFPDVGTTYNDAATCATLVGRLLGGAAPVAAANCTGVAVPLRTGFGAGACQVQACPTEFPAPIVLNANVAQ